MSAPCPHLNFAAQVNVCRVTDGEDGPVKDYQADVTVWCADCKLPFKFIGMKSGLDFRAPMVSFDGLEARIPLRPSDEKGQPPAPRIRGFGIKRDGKPYIP